MHWSRAMNNQISWVEKYRPKSLTEVVGHDQIKRTFNHYRKSKQMPNCLLSGPPGCGKTALIHAFTNDLYGDLKFKGNFKEWNSSDARGIDVVRGPIKEAAQYGPKGDFPWQVLYLGEIDGMTEAAQDALKRTMETAYRTVRFIADCNNIEKVIPAIQSRFCKFTVKPALQSAVLEKLHGILQEEDKMITLHVLKYIHESQNGDFRNCIQILEGLPWDDDEITVETVRGLFPSPLHKDIVDLLFHTFSTRSDWFEDVEKTLSRILPDDPSCSRLIRIMFEILDETDEEKLSNPKWRYLSLVGDYETRIHQGTPIHQLKCLLYALRELELK